jgi:ParB family chromosome partitioning protein
MKSYGTASRTALHTLLALRQAGERDAERALAAAAAALREAEEQVVRLVGKAEAAQAAVAAARRDGDDVGRRGAALGRAAEAQAQRRFWARLESAAGAAIEALARYRKEDLARAIEADAAARSAHLRARQRREVVEKAIARRQAAARREADRREEAANDDRYRRARMNTPTTGK